MRRCLTKDVHDRLDGIANVRIEIRLALTEPATLTPVGVGSAAQSPLWRRAIPWSIAVVAVIVAGIAGWRVTRSGAVMPVQMQRFSIDLPEGTILPTGVGTDFAISPDGQSLVYVAAGPSEKRLYLQRLDEFEATPIPGTEGAEMPFFSPDGQWVAFGDKGRSQLKRVPLSGGESFTLCNQCAAGFWGDDGSIVFDWDGSLWRIPEVGSSPELIAEPNPDRGVPRMSRPVLLPGGQAVLFEIGFLQFGGVGVLSLENDEVIVVSTDGSDPLYSSTGHILFARGNTLFAVPFDIKNFKVTEPAVPVLQGVRVENGGALQAKVSRDGLLVYAPASAAMGTQLVWVDRDGNVESVLDEQRQLFYAPRISPDGKKVVVQINDGGDSNIWIHESGTFRLLTTDGVSANPIWTPDGSGVAFSSSSAGSFAIQWTTADGTSEVKTLLLSEYPVLPAVWSPESYQLVFQEDSPNPNLFVADVRDGGSRTAFLETDFSEHSATLSHSGKWLAYVSNRSGSDEVYVRSFPGPGAEHVISRGGGMQPVWGPDDTDTELFYRGYDVGFLRVASLQTEPFQVPSRKVVFPARDFWGGVGHAQYDIHPDGQRFLMMNMQDPDGIRPKIHVILNWSEELKRQVPTKK
ncbi:MAG: PD40 domain-containing protein [Deltaproteobacteria bacterium]|nr:PD40 domain-containing protein [Deltaproteobacteria bacterium]